MKMNMGLVDRILRIVAAIVVATLYSMHLISGVLAIILLAVAGIFILTSFVGFCPIYGLFGLSSKGKHKTA